jgi:hypothetical protein
MLQKVYNSHSQKARQRFSDEDRSLQYKDWLRTVETNGYFLDIDLVKFRFKDGNVVPIVITELTRCDSETPVGQGYLDAIINRYFFRDMQGKTIQTLSDMLQVPAYLVVFAKNMTWLYVYSFRAQQWKLFTPDEWQEFLRTL